MWLISVVVSHFTLWLCIHFGSVLLLANELFLWLFHVWVILRPYNHLAAFFLFLFVDIKKILQHKFSSLCCHFVSNYSCFASLWYFDFLWRHFTSLYWHFVFPLAYFGLTSISFICCIVSLRLVIFCLFVFDVTLWLLYVFFVKFAAIYCHFKVSWWAICHTFAFFVVILYPFTALSLLLSVIIVCRHLRFLCRNFAACI